MTLDPQTKAFLEQAAEAGGPPLYDLLNSPDEMNDTRASPIQMEDLSGLPPALVLTAAHDPLCDEGA